MLTYMFSQTLYCAKKGHSGVLGIDPTFFTLLEVAHAWKVYISTIQDLRNKTGQSSKEG